MMLSWSASALGLALGLWGASRLQADTAGLLRQPHIRLLGLLWSWALRLLPLLVLISALLTWSVAAALAVLGGYWVGRTAYLLVTVLPAAKRRR